MRYVVKSITVESLFELFGELALHGDLELELVQLALTELLAEFFVLFL